MPAIFILFIFSFFIHRDVKGQCAIKEITFKPGEELTYEVSYNWGFIWINAGVVKFRVIDDKQHFKLISTGSSYGFYDWIYTVRDTFTSLVDSSTLLPLEFHRNTREGNYKVNNTYLFDYKNRRIISSIQNSEKPLTTDSLNLFPCTFDVLSGVYFVRTLDFSDKKPGQEIPAKVLIDGELYEIPVKYLGKEILKSRKGKKYRCLKLSAKLIAGTIFSEGKEIYVWVTDDKNKIPVMVEATILVGSIKAYLSDFKGLKYKLSSLKE